MNCNYPAAARPLFLCILLVSMLSHQEAAARNFRPGQMPNGTVFNCSTCHLSANGGGPRNPFGEAVRLRVSIGGTEAFWDASLAALDSDGDGFTNGQELGDPNGLWPGQSERQGASNPGNPNSFPQSPVFSSSPVTSATVGVAYSYQASAAEPNGLPVIYGKSAGPDWLSVSSSGLASGTPTGAAGDFSVTIRSFVNGLQSLSKDQVYTITVTQVFATFASWQSQNFILPAENAIASPNLDPDNDGLPNLVEYALKTLPKQANAIKLMSNRTFNGSGQLQFSQVIRDDDPKLSVKLEAAAAVPLASPTVINAVLTDPTPGDGLKTWTFTDTVSKNNTATRFGRLRFEILP